MNNNEKMQINKIPIDTGEIICLFVEPRKKTYAYAVLFGDGKI